MDGLNRMAPRFVWSKRKQFFSHSMHNVLHPVSQTLILCQKGKAKLIKIDYFTAAGRKEERFGFGWACWRAISVARLPTKLKPQADKYVASLLYIISD